MCMYASIMWQILLLYLTKYVVAGKSQNLFLWRLIQVTSVTTELYSTVGFVSFEKDSAFLTQDLLCGCS